MPLNELKILIRGAGEVASAVAHKLAMSNFHVCLTDIAQPVAVSRGVSFCEAIWDGDINVAGVTGRLVHSAEEIYTTWQAKEVPVLVDPEARIKDILKPDVLIDAIMAKKNLGTQITDAPLVIGLGAGFRVGRDVHLIVETNNSENIGKVLTSGEAEPANLTPVEVCGKTYERLLRHPESGPFRSVKHMGDMVEAGDVVGFINDTPVRAQIDGVVRALIRDGVTVPPMTKLGEIDPRGEVWLCYAIRPRMRVIAGGVLEAILYKLNR
jgi:xanthine dehydrogenase accessory factor